MNKKTKWWLSAAVTTATAIPITASLAFAICEGGNIPLRDSLGNAITNTTTPYSPKMTCMTGVGGCHTPEEYASTAKKTVTKTQGSLNANGEVVWQSYDVDAHAHGTTVSRHSQMGRNEDYSIAMKTAFGDAFFTSSPGMFGKY